MGCSRSKYIYGDEKSVSTDSRYWQPVLSQEEAMLSFEAEGTDFSGEGATKTHLELRALLNYAIGCEYLLRYSKLPTVGPFLDICLTAWLDIQAYNAMSEGDTKTTMAHSICKNYIKNSSFLNTAERETILEAVSSSSKTSASSDSVFGDAQAVFFKMVHDYMFLQFISTPEYDQMCCVLRRKYNRVKQNDFLYHQIIGKGGFGVVAEVSKKSTGVRYAMKLQRKDYIKTVYDKEVWRVSLEARSLANCHHPFIIELHFAFQTPTLIAMVTSLGTGRDLSRVLKVSGPLKMEQVRFYAAEITSALSYIHDKGLVYRDLKPGNVLLNMDGHIQLVDFGGAHDLNSSQATAGNICVTRASMITLPLYCQMLFFLFLMHIVGVGVVDGEKSVKSCTVLVSESECSKANDILPLSQYWSGKIHRADTVDIVRSETVRHTFRDNVLLSVSAGPDVEFLWSRCTSYVAMCKLRNAFPTLTDATILRHLLACHSNYDKAVAHIEACELWRLVNFPLGTLAAPIKQSNERLKCFVYTHGVDANGHPLLILTPRLISNESSRDIDELVRWWIYMVEVAISRLPVHLEQFTVLANRIGMTRELDIEFGRQIFPIWDKYYPFRRHKLLVYPVSQPLKAVGGLLKHLASKQCENVEFVESIAALRKEIPDEYIPEEMGGSCSYQFDIADYPEISSMNASATGYANPVTDSVRVNAAEFPEGGHPSSERLASLDLTSWTSTMPGRGASRSPNPSNHQRDGSASRAKSLVGTYNYMAPEMVVLLVQTKDFVHTGYTQAVDWWSLGVTIYRLLSGKYPFNTNIPKPLTPEEILMEGSNRYAVLLEKVDYSPFVLYPDAIDLISKLLTVDDSERLGYGLDGSSAVSEHPFFRTIDWVLLEQKQLSPPKVPQGCTPRRIWREPVGLDMLLQLNKMGDWIQPTEPGPEPDNASPKPSAAEEGPHFHLLEWDYTSPAAILTELESRK